MGRLADILTRGLSSWKSARGLDVSVTTGNENSNGADTVSLFERPGRKFLHVGCGPARKPDVAPCFLTGDWLEIRLDIDLAAKPDVVCSMLEMTPVPASSVDAVYSSHNIEHLHAHEVPLALAEFLRVLKPDGLLVLACTDLQSVCGLIAQDRVTEPAYLSPAGPIAPLDILYGHRAQLADGNLFMAHHTGFTLRTLVDSVRAAGFRSVAGRSRNTFFDLWIVASKVLLQEDEITRLSETYLPPP